MSLTKPKLDQFHDLGYVVKEGVYTQADLQPLKDGLTKVIDDTCATLQDEGLLGAETFAVDTHIFRVGNRTRIAPGKTVDAVERAIEDNIPVDFQHHAHHWMILHGRYHCKARKPLCRTCIIRDLCPYEEKTE